MDDTSKLGRRFLVLALTAGLAAIFVRLAWIGDDAYITLRSVENLVTGHGLRWNAAERVQINTHPLWTLVLAAGRGLTGELYFTTIWIGITLSLAAVACLWRLCPTPASVLAMAAILACSRGFTEYATSGLETPLTYLLLVGFAATVTKERTASRRWAFTVLAASLVVANRLDLCLLCAPAVLVSLRGVAPRRAVGLGLLAAAPLLAWLCVATVYYGTPLPVVAYAKALGHGIPAWSMAEQGLYYAWHTAIDDPVLMATMITGTIAGSRDRRLRPLAFGVVLYAAYVVKVGGDFMAGRFFVPPFVVAVVLFAHALGRNKRWSAIVMVVAPALMFCRGVPAWLRDPTTDTLPEGPLFETRGIADERRFYYGALGLLSPTRGAPKFEAMISAFWPEGRTKMWVAITDAAGTFGFNSGRLGHLVDPWLCDPLLARLPARDPTKWRIGHIQRRLPEGYLESVNTGENHVRHPGLHRYYGALQTIVRQPVFAPERLQAVWHMWKGDYDDDLASFLAEEYFAPPRVAVAADALSTALPLGVRWFDEPRVQIVYDGGLAIDFGKVVEPRELRLQVAGTRELRLRFVLGGAVQGECGVRPPGNLFTQQMLQDVEVLVPLGVRFDTLWVDPYFEVLVPPALGALTIAR